MTSEGLQNFDSDAGFTLVELLVSLALVALLSVLLLDGIRYGILSWQRSTGLASETDDMLTTQNFLRRLIEEAYPFYVLNEHRKGYVIFEGSDDAIDFLSFTPVALGGAGRTRYRLHIEEQDGQRNLVLTHRMELADPTRAPAEPARKLIRNIDSVEFSYFSNISPSAAARWNSAWLRQTRLPDLVRIRVSFQSDSARSWPDLFVAPKLSVDVGCVYDPLTKGCRGR